MVQINRRDFAKGAMGLFGWGMFAGGFGGCSLLSKRSGPNLVFGIVSDIHIRLDRKDGKDTFAGAEMFRKTLEWFRDQGVDGVTISGDLADCGFVEELEEVGRVWRSVFPDDKAPDGRHVERLFVYGNHDWEGFKYGNAGKNMFGDDYAPHTIHADLAAAWKKAFGEEYAPIWRKEVKGYTFIGAHWGRWRGIDAVEPYFAAIGDSLKGDRPFFYIQHPQPRNTCLGDWCWGADSGQATRALSPYPNAVALSGHSHKSLRNERNVWQGAFTSIGTATLSRLGMDGGRENAGHFVRNHRSVMQGVRGYVAGEGIHAAHGQLVSVYDGFIEVERREFVRGEPVGANWVVPVPAGGEAPFRYESRQMAERVPAPFPDGAKVVVSRTKDRVRLEFPSARVVAGCAPVEDYEIEAIYTEGEVTRTLFTRYVYGPEAFRQPSGKCETVVAEFDAALFPPGGDVTFRVRAHTAFGHFNTAIS